MGMVIGKWPRFEREDERRTEKKLKLGRTAGMVTGKGPKFGGREGRVAET